MHDTGQGKHKDAHKKLLAELDMRVKQDDEIAELITNAQFCCLVKNIKIDDITDRLKQRIRRALNKKPLSPELNKQLGNVLKQIVENLALQKTLYFNQVISYLISENLDRIDINFLDTNLVKLCTKNLEALGFKRETVHIDMNEEQTEIYSRAQTAMKNHVNAHWDYKLAAKYGMLFCVGLAIWTMFNDVKPEDSYFNIRNIILFAVAAFMYLYGSHILPRFTLSLERDKLLKQEAPKWELEKIKFIEPESSKSKGIAYFPRPPTDERKIQSIIDSSFPNFKNNQDNQELSSRTFVPQTKVKRKYQSVDSDDRSYVSPPKPMPKKISWPGSSVLFGDEKASIPERRVHGINSDRLPNHIFLFGYFNKDALKQQTGKKFGLIQGDNKWKFLKSQVANGQSVSPQYNTGHKRLKPPVAFNVRIGGHHFGMTFFQWSVKNATTEDRLVGTQSENAIQKDSAGNIYMLVDYCYYLKKGPGH
jgi:hypothetical protein